MNLFKIYFISGLLASLLVLGSASIAFSDLRTLGDRDLGAITGQSGVSIYENGYASVTMNSLQFYDSGAVNSIEFSGVTIGNGSGGPFQFYTPISYDFEANPGPSGFVDMPITLDVGTNSSGRTILQLVDSSHMSPRTYTVDRFFFCGVELGYYDANNPSWSLRLAGLEHIQPDIIFIGAHAGSTGIDFAYETQLYASSFQYNYNNTSGALSFKNIYLANAANGANDNPADPSTWHFTGNNRFQIGNIDTNPATFDVGTNKTDPDDTALFLNLPMSGSLRIGEVDFGGTPLLGPIAIDGIDVHHLIVKISTK